MSGLKFTMPPPRADGAPYYWRHEASGIMSAAVDRWLRHHLHGSLLHDGDLEILIDYCRQWVGAAGWAPSDELTALRAGIEPGKLKTPAELHAWLMAALHEGIDPL